MRIGFIEIPSFPWNVYNTVKKSGSRVEYSLSLSDELTRLGSQISSLPLRFASLVKAIPSSSSDQEFHADSKQGERAIIYLTNVEKESNGPIEFKEFGKVLGKAGTFVHYSAQEIHRGCKSDIDRYALALAFDTSLTPITTVGVGPASCNDFECDEGYIKLDSLPNTEPYNNDTCCEEAQSCDEITCESGTVKKATLPSTTPFSQTTCCQIIAAEEGFPYTFLIVIPILILLLALYFYKF